MLAPMRADVPLAFLAGDSVMAHLMRERDWKGSPLGPPRQWSQSLRSVVNLMLGSAFPMFVAWGPQLAQLYNDAYMEVMGDKHRGGLGQSLHEVWSEIRDDVGPLAERALRGDSRYFENLPLRMRRGRGGSDNDSEETWFTFSYSPVQDDNGVVAGMFCACIETTRTVLEQGQLRAQQQWLEMIFQQAPGFAAVLRGPDHVFEMVNEAYLKITGNRPLIGKPLAEALPEMAAQDFPVWLDRVHATGEPFAGRSVPVMLNQLPGTAPVQAYIDFVYQPLKDAAGKVDGIFVQGHEVTEQHQAQKTLLAFSNSIPAIAWMAAPDGMLQCFNSGAKRGGLHGSSGFGQNSTIVLF
jgi:PAS domain-containing protein